MKADIKKIKNFYQSDIGEYARQSIANAMSNTIHGDNILCVTSHGGYFYEDILRDHFTTISRHTPDDDRGDVQSLCWPTTSATADYVVMVHDIEFSKMPDNHIAEAWRVLKDNGKLVVVFPNRAGQWAQYDTTPFGVGTPQSHRQMKKLLSDKRFQVINSEGLLYYPPATPKLKIIRELIDKTAGLCGLYNAGVMMIFAEKISHKGTKIKPLSEKAEDVVRGALSPKPTATPKVTLDSRTR